MNIERRDFIKKSGLLSAAGFLSTPFAALSNGTENFYRKPGFAESFLIRNAFIISMDEAVGDLKKGSILIEDGEIKEVGPNISVSEEIEVIEGEGCIVMPGLIDCHWHLWTSLLRSLAGDREENGYFPMTARYSRHYSEKDMKIAATYAAAEAIHAGITTLSDFNHNARNSEYVMASCNALAEAGLRAEVQYGGYRQQESSEPTHFAGIQSVVNELEENEKYKLINLGLGSRGSNYRNIESDWEKARELGMRITIHASSTADQKGQIQQLAHRGMLGNDVNIIHANAITDREIKAVKEANTSITMTPFSEMRIGYGMPKVNELYSAGINTALGVDSTALTGNADLFSIMKLVQNISNAEARDEFFMQPEEVLKMATINGARTLGLEQVTGSLSPGKRADIIMLRKNHLNFSFGKREKHLVVEAAQPENVDLVMVDGRILKRNGKLTNIAVDELIPEAESAFERMYQNIK